MPQGSLAVPRRFLEDGMAILDIIGKDARVSYSLLRGSQRGSSRFVCTLLPRRLSLRCRGVCAQSIAVGAEYSSVKKDLSEDPPVQEFRFTIPYLQRGSPKPFSRCTPS